ncbi:MAG: hypothetical protein RQ899_03705 [Pseudomonadales bacterium]|nr:hypothetical protein [Pseudomonadales bacterium]
MKVLVIQSYKTEQVPIWIERCLETVRHWAQRQRHDYRFVGDEIFARVPRWYLEKVGDKLPVAIDYARLLVLQEALAAGYEQVLWFDADTLILDQDLSLDFEGSCAFGQEHWVQLDSPCRYRIVKNVHNALCVFRQNCVLLPFLIETVASIIKRVDPERIAPQMVGPKLLTALHTIAGFTLLPQCGALSPEVLYDLTQGGGPALDLQRQKQAVRLQAVNLCASLIDADIALRAVDCLLADGI